MRHPIACTANSVGAVAVSRPSAPNDITKALASARRGSGTHSTTALNPLMRPPAKPMPIMARATVRVRPLLPIANSTHPAPATATSAACTRRGP